MHPQRARLASDLRAGSGFETAQDRVPDAGGIICLRPVAESRKQFADMTLMEFDSPVAETSMLPGPVQECIKMFPAFGAGMRFLFAMNPARSRSGAPEAWEPANPLGLRRSPG